MLDKYNLTVGYVATKINRTVDDILPWFDGSAEPPAYLEFTLRALRANRRPATLTRMADPYLSILLCTPAPIVDFWHRAKQYPLAARYAVATIDAETDTLSAYETQLLGRIITAGKYYRYTGGWRPRVIGLPHIRKRTVNNLKRLGYVQIAADGTMTATAKGRDKWFIR